MTLYAFTDGASRGNPGHAGIGVIVKDESGTILVEEKQYIGKTTNNVAEYTALVTCLKKLQTIRANSVPAENQTIILHSDSELMVNQMIGVYKIKDKTLTQYASQAKELLDRLGAKWTMKHIPRELNRETDRLANKAIDEALH